MTSHIDRRLAAEFQFRQIESIVRLEAIAEKIEILFFVAGEKLVDAAAVGKSKPQLATILFQGAFTKAQEQIFDEFEKFAFWSFDESVAALARSIPNKYLRVTNPKAMASQLEDETGSAFELPKKVVRLGQLLVDVFTEPIIGRKRKYSKAKWLEVLKQLVFEPPSLMDVQRMIMEPDATGHDWQDRLLNLSRRISDAERLANQLAIGYSEGENLQQMKRRALPLVQGIQSSAKRIVRTEGLRVAERIQRRSWDALGDMMIGAQILAVLDERTRPHHALRNGRVYYKNPTGNQPSMAEIPLLPDEPNCRCYTTPVLRPPKEIENDPVLAAEFATQDGSGIVDPATYDGWFAGADVQKRKLAVGVQRYKTVEKLAGGEPEWTDFVDETGQLMPVDKLKSETAKQREARKQKLAELIRERSDRLRQISSTGFLL